MCNRLFFASEPVKNVEIDLLYEKERYFFSIFTIIDRSSRVVRASGCQSQSRNSPGLSQHPPTQGNLRGRGVDEAVLNNVHTKEKNKKNPPF